MKKITKLVSIVLAAGMMISAIPMSTLADEVSSQPIELCEEVSISENSTAPEESVSEPVTISEDVNETSGATAEEPAVSSVPADSEEVSAAEPHIQ